MKNPDATQEVRSEMPGPVAILPARLEAALDKVAAALHVRNAVEKVHEARKGLKAYRALLRLIATPEAKAQRQSAAAIARLLSGDRDQQASRDALRLLVSRDGLGAEDERTIRGALESHGKNAGGEGHSPALRAWLQQARHRHAEELDGQAAEVDLVKAMVRGYQKARRDADFSTPEALHELRKRVVTHRYQMAFFSDLTGKGARRVKRAQSLRETLGAIQDLETLQARVEERESVPPDLAERLMRAVRQLQRSLAQEARAQHHALFRRPGRRFRAHLSKQAGKAALVPAD